MSRARRSSCSSDLARVALGIGLGVGLVASTWSSSALAQCVRPTDPAGYGGRAYGADAASSFDSARIRVWYTRTGPNAVRVASTRPDEVPDDVAEVSAIAEGALSSYAAAGFRAPLADDDLACGSNGGDGRLDLYLVDFAAADGTTVAERCQRSGKANACASFMMVEARMDQRYATAGEGYRTVVPHELFHAVQNAYDAELDRFFSEGTAQLLTKRIYPALPDLERFLPQFFAETSRSLDSPGGGVTAGFLYGSAVWPLFLSKTYGEPIVRRVLEAQASGGGPVLDATARVLTEDESSLGAAFLTFATWNSSTGKRAATGGYDDAARYPQVKVVDLPEGGAGVLSGLGAFYYRVAVDAPRSVKLEADPARVGATLVPVVDGRAVLADAKPLPHDLASGEAIVVVAGLTTAKSDARFAITLADPIVVSPSPTTPTPAPEPPATADAEASGGCIMHGMPGDDHEAITPFVGALCAALYAVCRARRREKARS